MRSRVPMRVAKLGYIVVSLLIIAFGIRLICLPELSSRALGTACGILMILFGAIKLVGYFSGDLFRLAFQYDLASGMLSILVGTVLLIRPDFLMEAFYALFAIIVLADGLFKIQITIDAKRFGINKWWLILISAVISGILGLTLLVFPLESIRTMTIIFGIMLLADGISNICTMLTAVKIIKNQKPDYIEGDFKERNDK